MKSKNKKQPWYHLIGIGGIGMSGIAFILSQQGYKVTGSDLVDSKITRKLKALGTKVYIGHDEKNISPEMDEVVVSSAVPEKNPEIIAARRYKIPIIKRSRVLGELMALKRGVAVTGTHGKTTTSTMIGLILEAAKLDPTILVGGEVKNIGGNFKVGKGDFFVAEACEFDRSFLDLVAEVAVITNIEADHLDYYKDLEEIIEAFGQFIEKIPPKGLLVINGDDKNAAKVAARAKCKVVSFGIKNGDWKAKEIKILPGQVIWQIENHESLGKFKLKIPGIHNILDATAATIAAYNLGVDVEIIKKVLANFEGVDRRFQIKGEVGGVTVIDDYGHHPTEIRATLAGAKQFYPDRRIVCVFEPHQYSRTRLLLSEFAVSFGDADLVIIPDIYRVRDSDEEIKKINSQILVDNIKKQGVDVRYIAKYPEIVQFLDQNLKSGDLLITMGAGNIYKIGDEILTSG